MHEVEADAVREFRLTPDARRRAAVIAVLRTYAVVLGVALVIRLARGGPLLAFGYLDLAMLVLVPALFALRARWGDRLVFDGDELRVYRGGDLRRTIPLGSVEKASQSEGAVTVVWTSESGTERQFIARGGFGSEEWRQIRSLLERRGAG